MAQLADVVLQVEQSDGTFRCFEFTGVPAARKSWICLTSTGSPIARGYVRELAEELEAALRSSSAVEHKDNPCTTDPPNLNAKADPELRKVLVLAGSPDEPIGDRNWYSQWDDDTARASVMVALPTSVPYDSLFVDAINRDPEHLLRRVNASLWQKRVTETVPGILARAEITSESNRVFISYRRLETLPLALQLFDALTHEGFEVFLDRFSIAPGYDFQRKLNQELADKSMVVLLESRFIQQSEWTKHEIGFTLRNRLGLLVVRMPDIDPGSLIVAADAVPLATTDFKDSRGEDVPDGAGSSYKRWGEIKPESLSSLLKEIKRVHAEALFRRRHRLRSDLVATLNSKGIPLSYSAVGPFQVSQRSIDHFISTITRPPQVTDFHELHNSCAPETCANARQGVLVGPLATFEPDREKLLIWLERVTGCTSFDEGKLSDLASWLTTGQRP